MRDSMAEQRSGSLPGSLLGRVVVLSTHLDDGVLSLGAWMRRSVRRGTTVTLVTVLAGDPDDEAPATAWDRRSGFRTVGEAAGARRDEDRRACAILGIRPHWLSYGDMLSGRGGSDDAVWDALEPLLAAADAVVVPGFPLVHPDHEWLAGLVTRHRRSLPEMAVYVEQPYRYHAGEPPSTPSSIAHATGPLRWVAVRSTVRDRTAKWRAARAYRSQLGLLSDRPALALRLAWGARRAGEALAWLD